MQPDSPKTPIAIYDDRELDIQLARMVLEEKKIKEALEHDRAPWLVCTIRYGKRPVVPVTEFLEPPKLTRNLTEILPRKDNENGFGKETYKPS